MCEEGEILIPKLQRDFVWKQQQVANLLYSLLDNIPIQSFIFWRTKECLECKTTDGANFTTNKKDYKLYVLDGQQRIKSLYKLFDKKENWIIDINGIICKKTKTKFIPLYELVEAEAASIILKKYEMENVELEKVVNNLLLLLSRDVLYYHEIFSEDVDIFDVFERINTGGTKLSMPDLIKCRFNFLWPDFIDECDSLISEFNKHSVELTYKLIINYLRCLFDTKDIIEKSKSNWTKIKNSYLKALENSKTLFCLKDNYINIVALYCYYSNTINVNVMQYLYYLSLQNRVCSGQVSNKLFNIGKRIQTGQNIKSEILDASKLPTEVVLRILYYLTMQVDDCVNYHVDHIFPISELKHLNIEEIDDLGNKLLLPKSVNIKKSNMSTNSFFSKSVYGKQLLIAVPSQITNENYKEFITNRKSEIYKLVNRFLNE